MLSSPFSSILFSTSPWVKCGHMLDKKHTIGSLQIFRRKQQFALARLIKGVMRLNQIVKLLWVKRFSNVEPEVGDNLSTFLIHVRTCMLHICHIIEFKISISTVNKKKIKKYIITLICCCFCSCLWTRLCKKWFDRKSLRIDCF